MKKVFIDANEKYVATVIIFKNDDKYYYDEAFKKEVPAEDMLNLFLKGVTLKDGTTYKAAVSCDEDGTISFGA